MYNASKFLTEEQLGVCLNLPGTLWTTEGAPAEDDTLGGELKRYCDTHGLELIAVNAEFRKSIPNEEGGDVLEGNLSIAYFQAWTKKHVLVVLDSIFCDKYLAVIPINPPVGSEVKQISPDEEDQNPTQS